MRQLTGESYSVYDYRGIRVRHGGKVWQQASDMTGGAETKGLTSLPVSTKQIVNWKRHVTLKLHTSSTKATPSKPTQTAPATGDKVSKYQSPLGAFIFKSSCYIPCPCGFVALS